MKRSSKPPGGIIERLLWGSRLLVLVAVVAGVVLAVGAACLATVDAVYFIGTFSATSIRVSVTRHATSCGAS